MRISLNLAVSRGPREKYALVWTVPVTLLALAGLVYLSMTALGSVGEYHRVRSERVKLQEEEVTAIRAEKDLRKDLEQPQYSSLFRETQFVNGLIEKKRVSLAHMMETIGKLLPPGVHLIDLTESQKEGRMVRLTVTGGSVEAVEKFFINLQDSPAFRDPTIVDQRIEEGGEAAGQVIMPCTARYVGEEREAGKRSE